MNLRLSSIPLTLDYLEHSLGDEGAARALLAHPDYQFEARRYGLPSVEHLVPYLARLDTVAPEDIPQLCPGREGALRGKHLLWLDCLAHLPLYRTRFARLEQALAPEKLSALEEKLRACFLQDISLEGAHIISTLSFGPSFGYAFENALHLDLFGIGNYVSLEGLPFVLLHEMHHLCLAKLEEELLAAREDTPMTPLEQYLFTFTGEGLAVKFCNNAEGVISRRLDPTLKPNIALPAFPLLNCHFPEHFALFCDTVARLGAGTMPWEEVERQLDAYWWNPRLYPQESKFLEQTPVYSFGNDLFGTIYDAFGLEAVFDCFRHPLKTISYFNRSGCGYAIPAAL